MLGEIPQSFNSLPGSSTPQHRLGCQKGARKSVCLSRPMHMSLQAFGYVCMYLKYICTVCAQCSVCVCKEQQCASNKLCRKG